MAICEKGKEMEINGHHFVVHPRAAAPEHRAIGETLYDVYRSFSPRKQCAYDYCRRIFNDLDGWNFAITSANTFVFTVMFDFAHPETGELMRGTSRVTYLRLIDVDWLA